MTEDILNIRVLLEDGTYVAEMGVGQPDVVTQGPSVVEALQRLAVTLELEIAEYGSLDAIPKRPVT